MKVWSARLCHGPFSFSIRLFTTANDPTKDERRSYPRTASRQAPVGSIRARVSCPDGANFRRSARCPRQSAAVLSTTNTISAKRGEPSSMTTHPPSSTVMWSTMTRLYGWEIKAFSDARSYSPLFR